METTERTAAQEWRQGWPLVLSCMLAVTWLTAPAASMSFFLEPLEREFHWGRADISLGLFIYSMLSIVLVPIAGALVDKYGTRTIAVPGLVLNGLAYAAFAMTTATLFHWWGGWVIYTVTQVLVGTYVWNGAVSAAFVKSRGLAIAVTMGGTAIGQFVTPFVARGLIDTYGWRHAFVTIGIGWAGLAAVVAIFLFHDPRARGQSALASETAAAPPAGGLTLREALRTPRFLRIALAMLLQGTMITGLNIHLIPLLGEAGSSPAQATAMAAMIGALAMLGQFVTGTLADRTQSTLLPVSCFVLPAIAYLLLLNGKGAPAMLWLGVLLAGYAMGAAINITTYMTTRYCGLAHFGKVYGIISMCMRIGAGLGPLIAGLIFDRLGGYDSYLMFGIAAALVAGLSVLRLGAYPRFDTPATQS